MPGNSTLEEVGTCTRTIGIKTTHDKARFTVVLGARADGSKIHRMVIFKGKRGQDIGNANQSSGADTGACMDVGRPNLAMADHVVGNWLEYR